MITKNFYRLDEVADHFRVTRRTVRNWIKAGHLKAVKINGKTRISREELEKYLRPAR